jgi:uncharacterized repeat protein (TIGR02543 family)
MGKTKFKVAFVTLIFSTVFLLAGCGDTGVGPSSASKYTVTYNGNGNTSGSVPSDPTTYQQGGTVTVLGNTGSLVKTGYSFNDWNTTAYGFGTTYTTGQTFTMGAANITLYAKWTSNIASGYSITYNGNGGAGSVPVDSNRYYAGQTVTMPGNSGLTYTGYSFVGWQTKADGSGTTYAAGKTLTMGSANDTLYALWARGYAYTANNEQGYGGSISQYTIGPNGALTPMFTPKVSTGGNDPRYIAADPLGKYIYVSNITSNTVSQFTIGPDGSLAAMSTPTVLMGDVTGGKLYYPSGIAVNPTSQYAYVALQQKSRVNQYTIGADGNLSALTPSTVVSGDTANGRNGPASMAIDPSGKWAYVANGGSNTVSQYSIGADGTLSALTPFLVATGGKTGAGSASDVKIASTSSGEYVYVANYFDGTVSQYSINATTGMLSQLTPFTVQTAGTYAFSIAVHPTGKFAYVAILAGSANAVVAQFTIDQSTGKLLAMTPPTVSAGGAGAASIAVEASGKYAYATSGNSGWGSYSVAQYTIDQTTGALTLMDNPMVQSGFGPGGIVTVGK